MNGILIVLGYVVYLVVAWAMYEQALRIRLEILGKQWASTSDTVWSAGFGALWPLTIISGIIMLVIDAIMNKEE